MREAHTSSSQATLPVHLRHITICVLKKMSCAFIVEPCTYSSNRGVFSSLLPESCRPQYREGYCPSSLGRIWTKLTFLRSSGIWDNASNYSENKAACVTCVCALYRIYASCDLMQHGVQTPSVQYRVSEWIAETGHGARLWKVSFVFDLYYPLHEGLCWISCNEVPPNSQVGMGLHREPAGREHHPNTVKSLDL